MRLSPRKFGPQIAIADPALERRGSPGFMEDDAGDLSLILTLDPRVICTHRGIEDSAEVVVDNPVVIS
jgi:hypothetical protein